MSLRFFFLLAALWLTPVGDWAWADSLSPAQITTLAGQGDAAAQYELARMYRGGSGVTQDYRKAAEWYRRAAEQGYAPAQRSLAGMYRGGYGGLPKDDAEAKKWYGKAAAQGDIPAKLALALDPVTSLVRGLPQGYRDTIFFIVLALMIVIPIGICILLVVWCVKFIRRTAQRS